MKTLKHLIRDQRAQTMVITALCLTILLGMAGLSVDVGLMFRAKRVLQTAADAGAISGAAEVRFGDVTKAADAATAQNGATDGVDGVAVTVNNPPSSGPRSTDTNSVDGASDPSARRS